MHSSTFELLHIALPEYKNCQVEIYEENQPLYQGKIQDIRFTRHMVIIDFAWCCMQVVKPVTEWQTTKRTTLPIVLKKVTAAKITNVQELVLEFEDTILTVFPKHSTEDLIVPSYLHSSEDTLILTTQ